MELKERVEHKLSLHFKYLMVTAKNSRGVQLPLQGLATSSFLGTCINDIIEKFKYPTRLTNMQNSI